MNKIKRIIIILSIALLLSILLIAYIFMSGNSFVVKNNVVYADDNNISIELYETNPDDGDQMITPFMFPGDSYTETYEIKTYYTGNIKLYYRIFNYDELSSFISEFNGKVYGARIKVVVDSEEKYNGLFKDLPDNFVISKNQNSSDITTYSITLSLDKGMQSDYTLDNGKFQDKEMKFDMEWWVEGGKPIPIPHTGIDDIAKEVINSPTTYVILTITLGLIFIVILRRDKKHYEK